jgi:hypothetical protein
MFPSSSQFSQHAGNLNDKSVTPVRKIKGGSGGAYTQLNQMLDFQIKQAKLRKLNEGKTF